MKLLKYIKVLAIGTIALVSCDKVNEDPKFNDKDAFVAVSSKEYTVAEDKGVFRIPVLLTSLSGLSSTVSYVVKDSTARKGTHYEVVGNGTLELTKDAPQGFIEISIKDNDTFGGDKLFTVELSDPGKVNMGAVSYCVVKIEDNEHPLAFLLGTFTAKASSGFVGGDDGEWTVKTSKDEKDVTKIWFSNFVLNGSGELIYGVVNEDKTVLQIPVGQIIMKSSSYPKVLFNGFFGPDGNDNIPAGGKITADIAPDGTITIRDWFGSQAFTDDAASVSAGWFAIWYDCVMKIK